MTNHANGANSTRRTLADWGWKLTETQGKFEIYTNPHHPNFEIHKFKGFRYQKEKDLYCPHFRGKVIANPTPSWLEAYLLVLHFKHDYV